MSKYVGKSKCPKCGSEDNLAVYDDHVFCFGQSCGFTEKTKETVMEPMKPSTGGQFIPLSQREMPGIEHRGILADTINRYQVSIPARAGSNIEAVFPRIDPDGTHVGNQIRYKGKSFSYEGSTEGSGLFGQNLFPKGGRSITVTEGYYDTLASYQMTGSRYPNVGVMSASTAKKEVANNFEYLDSFDKIVFNFDNDEPGQKAVAEVAQLFSLGKVVILKLDKAKDANEYLMNGWIKEYINEWFRAPVYKPDGLLLGSEMWETIRDHKTPHSVPYPWDGLNGKLYGLRLSELVLLLADTGVGKTSVCKGIEYSLLMNEDLIKEKKGVGFLHFEEPKYDTAIGLMSIHAKKPFHLPDTAKTEEELKNAYDDVINSQRVVIWDHFGSNDVDTVLAKIRHMAALGCSYIFIDHLSIIVSDQSGDERKQLDEISTKLKTLMMNLNIAVVAVIHINRQGQARGSAGPEQVANIIIRLEREKKDPNEWRRNILKLTVEKNRFCGRTGPACYLSFSEQENSFEELTKELIDEYESGGSGAGHEFENF